ncbi:MAG TPA: 3-phosphoserine/phosphohydroxythreonine transaminase [Methylophilaceae bacterium]|nr:3-phosphoserine/phosphohydroxythreonine transaminase [Methylophilaceae bacterium]HQR59819.1 3-phosphoserine/phosphohydroxythreonine transaminase [Methylophilaceae bacterium]
MSRVWNFSAGPAVLPQEVLEQVRDEMLEWHDAGMSVMEMSHRGKAFTGIIEQAEADLRALLNVPANYKILFMQGGAIAENAIIPLNLLGDKTAADYVVTGSWSEKSHQEARRYCNANLAASSGPDYTCVPKPGSWQLSQDPAYLFVCTNETIGGVEYAFVPDMTALGKPDVPVAADMSSHILSRPVEVSRYGLIFGGAQKNIGPAGLTIVIVRDDLLGRTSPICPSAFNYKTVADNGSMYNTPPTFGIYVAGLVFQWLKRQGGLAAIEQANLRKARLLYGAIDGSGGFYHNPIEVESRSRMNVPFTMQDDALDAVFLKQAEAAGLHSLKGHKSVGGLRASIYNAMPLQGVQALVDFMQEFARTHG